MDSEDRDAHGFRANVTLVTERSIGLRVFVPALSAMLLSVVDVWDR